MSVEQISSKLGDKEVVIETGKMAKQAGGSVTVSCGGTVLLAVATSAPDPKEGCDFLPMTVEYLEKTYAAGKIPGGFFKREGRPTESAILTARCIDRPIRPLFPAHYHYDTQVIIHVISADPECPPEQLAILAASSAISVSDIPVIKPVSGCTVVRIDGKFMINPSLEDLGDADLELSVSVTQDAVVMVEGEAEGASEEDMLAAIQFAHEACKPSIKAQLDLAKKAGKTKRVLPAVVMNADITAAVEKHSDAVKAALAIGDKLERYAELAKIKKEIKASVMAEGSTPRDGIQLGEDFDALKSKLMRSDILKKGKRIDGRDLNEIRQIDCEVGLLPKAHGSALFTRGETQALVVVTLGSSDDEQMIDDLLEFRKKSFMLNYNFPAFSVGEVRPLRSPGRREIGHGNLAERALASHLPTIETFPYTIRIVSEILESNGSSSMASVCGGSLALMDAGVPVTNPTAGIAMGLVKEGDESAILSDILGDEDHLGDMDFKVTGSKDGITALQMDIKIEGITAKIMGDALKQAKEGRLHILGKMESALSTARDNVAACAPRIKEIKIKTDRIRDVIGPGGKVIKGIVEETGAKIDIDDSGIVRVFAADGKAMDRATKMIEEITAEAEVGKVYTGPIKRITNFGAFVEIFPKTDGLLHISQIVERRLKEVEEVLAEGDVVNVKVLNVDNFGKIKLSMKEVDQEEKITAKLSA